MKGFKDSSGKFHPIRNKRSPSKTHRFHPKGYKPPTFGKKKPAGKWEITKTDYSGSKNVEIFTDSVHIYDDNGQEVVMWDSKEWKDDPAIIPLIKNTIKLAKQGKIDEIKKRIGFIERGTVDRDPYPTSFASRKARIFQDDPDAVSKLEVKLARLEKEKAYWKGLKPLPRTYQANEPDGAKRSFELPNINANIRSVKQKIELIKSRQEKNIGLERKTTFKNGRKVFFYEEVKRD